MITSVSQYIANSNVNLDKNNSVKSNGLTYSELKTAVEDKKKQTEKEDENKVNNLGLNIAKVALVAGVALFLIARGAPKKWRSKSDQIFKNLEDKDYKELGQGLNKKTTGFKIREILKRVLASSKAIFNLAPLKDVLVAKALQKSKTLSKAGDWLTGIFEKISVNTVRRSYKKTSHKFEILYADIAEANKKMPKDKADIINKKVENIKKIYDSTFTETARRERLYNVKRDFDGYDKFGICRKEDSLVEKVWNSTYKNFKSYIGDKKTYKTFISENLTADTKIHNMHEVNKKKVLILNSATIMCKDSFNLLKQLDTFIDAGDQHPRNAIKKIATQLVKYKKSVEAGKPDPNILLHSNVAKNLKNLKEIIKTENKYDADTIKEVSETIDHLSELIEHNKRGEINEIMSLFRQYLKPEDSAKYMAKLDKSTNRVDRALNNTIDSETDKLFDKIRDLKIGSAPKDTLGVLASLGIVGYGLSKADNNDERISVAAKYGIPTVGAVAIALYCTVGLISAGPSLLIGLASGLAMNQVGTYVDKFRKNYKQKTQQVKNFATSTISMSSFQLPSRSN